MRIAVALFAVIIIAAVVPLTMQSTLKEQGNQTTITNESFTPSGGDITNLNESKRNDIIYNDSVTVYNDSEVKMSEPDDYTWFDGNGTLKTNTTGDLAGDPSGNVTYGFLDTTEEHLLFNELISYMPLALGLAFIAFPVIIILRAL